MDKTCFFGSIRTLGISAILWLGGILLCYTSLAQSKKEIQFRFISNAQRNQTVIPLEIIEVDSIKVEQVIQARLHDLYESGYLSATWQVKPTGGNELMVDFTTGKEFKTANVSKGNVPDVILNKAGFRQDVFRNKPFGYSRVAKLMEGFLNYAENHGYPFASVKLDSISIDGNDIAASFNYESGQLVVFDSLIILGSQTINPRYLMTYLGIYKGNPYEELLIQEIGNKLSLLPYIRHTGGPIVMINGGKCIITISLEKVRVNKVDAVIGLLPNERGSNQMLITGQADLDLQNLFGSGKQILFNWQRFDVLSQWLKASYFHPNLLRTPINFRAAIDLMKQDTTFFNRSFDLEVSLLSRNSSTLGIQTSFYSSKLLSTSWLDSREALKQNADNNVTMYGLKYRISRYDDVTYPAAGWGSRFLVSVGQKKIIKNPSVSADYYEELRLNSLQYKIEGAIDKFWRLYKNIVLMSGLNAGYIRADPLFDSDKYRLGGLSTIRGFSEQSIYCSGFGILSLEARALLEKGTYVMLFYDQAIVDDVTDSQQVQYPLGTGAGLSFNTTAGTFNFVLAMGKSPSQAFGFNYSKIHFGYISRF